jgi:hypothetical protein
MKTLLVIATLVVLAGCVGKDVLTPGTAGPQGSGNMTFKVNGQKWEYLYGWGYGVSSSWDPSIGEISFRRTYTWPGRPGPTSVTIQCDGGVFKAGKYKLGTTIGSRNSMGYYETKHSYIFYHAGNSSTCTSETDSLNTGTLQIDFLGTAPNGRRVATGKFEFTVDGECGKLQVTEGEFDMYF